VTIPREPGIGGDPHPVLRLAQYILAAAAVVFVALALSRSWDDVQAHEWTLRWEWLVVSAGVFLAYYVMQSLAWHLLLKAFDLRAPLTWAIASWGRSILARYVPGNVFMFLGRLLACQRRGLEARRASAAMVYEQALGFCAALATLGLLFPFWEYRPGLTGLSLLGIPLLLILLHPRVFVPLADRVLTLFHREALGAVLGFGRVLALLCYYVATWFVAGLGCWALARGVTEVGADFLPTVTTAFAFAYVVGMAAFVFPGGLGVREAVLAGALRSAVGEGVALAWAVLLRLWLIAIEVAFVGLATLVERVFGDGSDDRGETTED
jgi:uncharacterized membrane protein YbhN (UPF0104 family)